MKRLCAAMFIILLSVVVASALFAFTACDFSAPENGSETGNYQNAPEFIGVSVAFAGGAAVAPLGVNPGAASAVAGSGRITFYDGDSQGNNNQGNGQGNSQGEVGDGAGEIIIGSDGAFFAVVNQDVYIIINLRNPENFVILSFTLNGQFFQSFEFERGSTGERLILRKSAGAVPGIFDYTVDEIRYISAEGTFNNVRIAGNQTVEVNVHNTVALPVFDGAPLTFGDALPNITTATVGGTISLDPGQTLRAGTHYYNWTFVPDGTAPYSLANLTGTINLTVERLQVTVEQPVFTGEALVVGDPLPQIQTATEGGTVSLNAGQTLAVGIGYYYWTFIPHDTDNIHWLNTTGRIRLNVAHFQISIGQPALVNEFAVLRYGDGLPDIMAMRSDGVFVGNEELFGITNGIVRLNPGQTLKAGTHYYNWTFTISPLFVPSGAAFINTTGTIRLTVERGFQSFPNEFLFTPFFVSASVNAVTLNDFGNAFEYSMGGMVWQNSTVFTGLNLTVGHHAFFVRLRGTANLYPGDTRTAYVSIITIEAALANPHTILRYGMTTPPQLTGFTSDGAGLPPLSNIRLDAGQPLWVGTHYYTWTFTPPPFGVPISTIFANTTGTIRLTVEKGLQMLMPGMAFFVESVDGNTVTLHDMGARFEYSFDGVVWQDSNVFNVPITVGTLTFYTRLRAVENRYPSNAVTAKLIDGVPDISHILPAFIFTTVEHPVLNPREYRITGLTDVGRMLPDLVIPRFIFGLEVRMITRNAFAGNTVLRSIVIPESVHTIEGSAFRDTVNLSSIIIPSGVGLMGSNVFSGWTSSQSILIAGRTQEPTFWAPDWNGGNAQVIWNFDGGNQGSDQTNVTQNAAVFKKSSPPPAPASRR